MNTYALIQRRPDATQVVAKVEAGTQGQAVRKLYRAHRIDPAKAASLGYAVEFEKPAQRTNHV